MTLGYFELCDKRTSYRYVHKLTAMKNLKLPAKTQRMVKDFMLSTQSTFDQQQELNKFLEMISPSLRFMVSSHIYTKMIVGN